MNKYDWVLFVAIAVFLGVIAYFTVELAEQLAKVAIALIGLAGGVVTALLRWALAVERQRTQSLWLARQKNYQALLQRLGAFVREHEGSQDGLALAHIESWVFGDAEVVQATNEFMGQDPPTKETLSRLLVAMRRGLGLPQLEVCQYNFDVLLPPKTERGLG